MFTCCPHCHTCFRITKPQLDVAQGHVRCGTCSKVFNGKQHLHEEMPSQSNISPATSITKKMARPKAATKIAPTTKLTKKTAHKKTAKLKSASESASTKPRQTKKTPVKKAPVKATIAKPKQNKKAQVKKRPSKNTRVSTDKTARNTSTLPPPDIDLFDYASISHNKNATTHSDESKYEEQDIDDIFEDLQSSISIQQPGFNAEAFEEDEDTALIDLSGMEDDWLHELTSDAVTEKNTEKPVIETEASLKKDVPPPPSKPLVKKVPEKRPVSKNKPPLHAPANTRYEYVDPNELLSEEKDISEILQDMNDQLSLEIDPSEYESFDESQDSMIDASYIKKSEIKKSSPHVKPQSSNEPEIDESDISGLFRHAVAQKTDNVPAVENNKDDFESSFLASLDSATLAPITSADFKKESSDKTVRRPVKPAAPAEFVEDSLPQPTTIETKENNLNMQSGFPEMPGSDNDVPYQLRDNFIEEPAARSIQVWLLYLAAIIILTTGMVLQLIIFRSTDIVDKFPTLETSLTHLCNTLSCRYSGPLDISQVKLLSRDIRVHPKQENALLITATMVNRAGFRQPYPDIEISMSDLSGDVVARRQFTAEQYLNRIYTPLLRMPAGQPVKIALEVIDPGRDAVNFEFSFH